MQLPVPLIDGVLLERENRYRARVATPGGETTAHVSNPGRLAELLYPGARVLLAPAAAPHRRTAYDLTLVYTPDDLLVSIDTRLAGPLFAEALTLNRLPPFADATLSRAEVPFGASRLDFALTTPDVPLCLVEVKSCTWVEDGVARWPDAPSERGRRHVLELTRAHAAGHRAALVWIVQRPDATSLQPNPAVDPLFVAHLHAAVALGVEVHAFTCTVTRHAIALAASIPVLLPSP